jgi:hypothetical protein
LSVYFRRGQSALIVVPTIASTTAGPTASELAAGVDVTAAVTGLGGFETSLNRINTPLMSQREELQVDGPQTLGDGTITLVDDDGTASAGSTARVAARTALAEGTTGYLVVAPSKLTPTTGTVVDVWPFKSGALNRNLGLDAALATSVCQVAFTASPRKDKAVLA